MKDHYTMNLDKQIKFYEDCITRLEECKRKGTEDLSRLSEEQDKAYEQIALLKIRKMMEMSA
ncbi:hypothetical protein ACFLTA_06510 [Bacteroidota bacterium]